MSKPREAASRALLAAAKRAQSLALDLRAALLAFEGEPRAQTLILQCRRLASDVEEYAVDLGRRPAGAELPIIAAIEARAREPVPIREPVIPADDPPGMKPAAVAGDGRADKMQAAMKAMPEGHPADWRDRSTYCLDLPAGVCKKIIHFGVATLGSVAKLVEEDGAAGLGSALGDGSGSDEWAGKVSAALRDYLAEQEGPPPALAGEGLAPIPEPGEDRSPAEAGFEFCSLHLPKAEKRGPGRPPVDEGAGPVPWRVWDDVRSVELEPVTSATLEGARKKARRAHPGLRKVRVEPTAAAP